MSTEQMSPKRSWNTIDKQKQFNKEYLKPLVFLLALTAQLAFIRRDSKESFRESTGHICQATVTTPYSLYPSLQQNHG